MTDAELQALSSAFRQVLAEQALEQRAAIAGLRSDLDTEVSRAALYREADSAARERTMRALADAVANAVTPTLHQLQQRCAELERQAVFKRIEPVAPSEVTQ